MRQITLILSIVTLFFISCKKDESSSSTRNNDRGYYFQCPSDIKVIIQPFTFPVWHPNGQTLGFNYNKLDSIKKIPSNGYCPSYYNHKFTLDSIGFYIINRDGTGLKRITNYNIYAPAWSPDGNWLAFALDSNIYKMRFTGAGFDTTNIIKLTTAGYNSDPSWTLNSDTIYFGSGNNSSKRYFSIWKMAKDGTNKTRLTQSMSNYPFVGSDSKIYFTDLYERIYSMDKNGGNRILISELSTGTYSYPKYFLGKVFCQKGSTESINEICVIHNPSNINKGLVKLVFPANTYDISINGEIVYSKAGSNIFQYDEQIGTLWIMNADGSNDRQLTFNTL
jgi:hypothetical protein